MYKGEEAERLESPEKWNKSGYDTAIKLGEDHLHINTVKYPKFQK